MPNNGAQEDKTAPMSGSLTDPPSPSTANPATDATPSFLATASKTIGEFSRLAKSALLVLLLMLLAGWYIWIGRVSTDDAQVDAHITAVASQVSGYVVALSIDDNVNIKEGDHKLMTT